MNKKGVVGIVLLVIIVVIGLGVGGYFVLNSDMSNSDRVQSEVVDVDLAEYVASWYYPKFLSGDNRDNPDAYDYVGYETAYDLEGVPRAYIFLYRKKGGPGNSIDELKEISWEIEADVGPTKYQLFGVHTAIISAVNTESPLIRSYGGLPGIMVRELGIKNYVDRNFEGSELGRLIFISPSEIDYELVASSELNKKPLSGNALLIASDNGELRKVSDVRAELKEFEEQKKENYKKMDREMRDMLEEGEDMSKLANIEKWKEFELEMNS